MTVDSLKQLKEKEIKNINKEGSLMKILYIKRSLILLLGCVVSVGCVIAPSHPQHHSPSHTVKCGKNWHGDRGCTRQSYGHK